MEKGHFNSQANCLIIENPSSFSPSMIREIIFNGALKSIIIKNGDSGLMIPSKALQTIKSSEGEAKTKAMLRLFNFLQDATKVILYPEDNVSSIYPDSVLD